MCQGFWFLPAPGGVWRVSYYIGLGSWIYFSCVPKDQSVGKSQPRICKDAKEYRFRGTLGRKVIFVWFLLPDLAIGSTTD